MSKKLLKNKVHIKSKKTSKILNSVKKHKNTRNKNSCREDSENYKKNEKISNQKVISFYFIIYFILNSIYFFNIV